MTDEEMAEKYAKVNVHYEIAKRENGADYAKEVSSVTIKQAYFAGFKAGKLQEKLNIRSCQNCKHNNKSCPNDGSCVHYSKWESFKNPQLIKAKEIIKKFLEFVNDEVEFDSEHPQEHTDLWNELCKKAEQFLKESE